MSSGFEWCAHAGKPERWVQGEAKRPHTHDVRTLTIAACSGSAETVLVSAGADAQLLAHSVPRFAQATSSASLSISLLHASCMHCGLQGRDR